VRLNDAVQQYVDNGDWLGLAGYYWGLIPDQYHFVAIAAPIVLIAFLVIMSRLAPPASASYGTSAARRAALVPVPTRTIKPKHQPYIPLMLGSVVIDLQPSLDGTIHTAISGTSGLGKSSSVLQLLELNIGVLVIALDNTKPIRNRIRELGGVEWTNEPDWPIGIDLLAGEGQVVSEVLVEGWTQKSQGDSGKWRTIAQDRIWSALNEMDRQGIRRNIPDLVATLWNKTGESEIDRACRDWAGRLMRLQRVMGNSLGQGLDLVQAMQHQKKVLLRLNPYIHPKDAPMIGGMLLVHARRVAQEAGVPFILVIEEAGQLDDYQDEIEPLAQAARDRGCPLILLTQNLSVLPVKVTNNISVWVSFAQEVQREMRVAAERLRLEPEHFEREMFPGRKEMQGVGWCYVRAPGVPTTLAHVELPKRKSPEIKLADPPRMPYEPDYVYEPIGIDGWRPYPPALGDGTVVEEIEITPGWVTGNPDAERMWAQCKRTGREAILWSPKRGVFYDRRGCLEWQGGKTHTKRGGTPRPRSTIGRRDITVYIEFYRWSRGSPEPTIDHLCDNPICCDPDHLEAVSIAENNARNEPRQDAFLAAGWRKAGGVWSAGVPIA
jgi:hypothetical protein